MKNALISPSEIVYDYYTDPVTELGYRVAQVEQTPFEVAPPLFWVACAEDVVADEFYYDPQNEQILPVPLPPAPPEPTNQPISEGTQTL